MRRFDFEEMNHLAFYDATDAPNLRGARNLMITGQHPYWQNFWKPGYGIGFEHTFIAALGDFLSTLDLDLPAQNPISHQPQRWFSIQEVLDAVELSADSRTWISLDSQALLLAGGFSVAGATNFCNLLPSQRIHSIELYAENALTMRR